MSDEQIRNPETGDHGSYEHEDLSPHGVIYFMIGLAVVVVVIYFIVFGMYHFLDTYEQTHQAAMSPMVTPQTDTRTVTHADTQAFPEPRLEESERTQLRQYIEDEDRKLVTYDWVDKNKGVVQIPIDRAMDLIVQRGLPVRPENATTNSENAQDSESANMMPGSPEQAVAPAGKVKEDQPVPKSAARKAAKQKN
jgi:hypothetical protein